MAVDGRSAILYLTRDHLYLYEGGAVLSLEFPSNLVKDLDVIDRDGFYNLVTSFIVNNKIVAAQIFFVLSEAVCFSKDFPITAPVTPVATIEAAVKEFIDAIPFSSVVSKIYKSPVMTRVVGSNQDLIDTIFSAFENKGFGISALVPSSVFPDFGIVNDLTIDKAQIVLNKKEIAVVNSMVGERTVKEQQLATSQTAVPKNKLLPYLIGVFAILIIVLVILVLMPR